MRRRSHGRVSDDRGNQYEATPATDRRSRCSSGFGLVGAACGNEGDDDERRRTLPTRRPPATNRRDQFADLEHVDEPDPCVARSRVSDTEIKVGTIAVESGPQRHFVRAGRRRHQGAHRQGEPRGRARRPQDHARRPRRHRRPDPQRRGRAGPGRAGEGLRDHRDIEPRRRFGRLPERAGVPVAGWHVGVPAWATYPNMFTFRQATADDPENEYTTRNAKLLEELGARPRSRSSAAATSRARCSSTGSRRSIEQAERARGRLRERRGAAPTQARLHRRGPGDQGLRRRRLVTGMDLAAERRRSATRSTRPASTMKVDRLPRRLRPAGRSALPGMEGAMFGLEFYPFE